MRTLLITTPSRYLADLFGGEATGFKSECLRGTRNSTTLSYSKSLEQILSYKYIVFHIYIFISTYHLCSILTVLLFPLLLGHLTICDDPKIIQPSSLQIKFLL